MSVGPSRWTAGSSQSLYATDYPSFLALQLAHHLGDRPEARHYASLASRYPQYVLTSAARRLAPTLRPGAPLLQLREALEQNRHVGPRAYSAVVGLKIDRRAIGYAIIRTGMVEAEWKRELSADPIRAIRTAVGFIGSECENWRTLPVAIINTGPPPGSLRAAIHALALDVLRENVPAVWELTRAEILAAFGNPPARSLQMVRRLASGLLPTLLVSNQSHTTMLDAGIAALYVDVRRQLLWRDEDLT